MTGSWDRESIESVKQVHHDPDFKGPNLSDKAEGNGMKVRFAGNVTGRQVTAVISLLATLITAYAGYLTHEAKGTDSSPAAKSQTVAVAPQLETQLATHEVRLNGIDKVLDQHHKHDEKIDDKLDAVITGISDLKVAVARLKPRSVNPGGGSQ
jgi:uncharacterized coiled-coil protein SlyX